MSATPAINTHVRLFDLVRFMRSELHQADLITDEEYQWLIADAELNETAKTGSPSPRRLEDYDDLRKSLRTATDLPREARVEFDDGDPFNTPGERELLQRIRQFLATQLTAPSTDINK